MTFQNYIRENEDIKPTLKRVVRYLHDHNRNLQDFIDLVLAGCDLDDFISKMNNRNAEPDEALICIIKIWRYSGLSWRDFWDFIADKSNWE
jgi:hypothetical protein